MKQDSVKIDERLFELIKQYCSEYQVKDYLFYSTSNHNKGGKMSTKCLREIINNLFKRAGINDDMITSHSLRHSSCEMLLESGVPIQDVSEFLRHKSLTTVMTYKRELDQRTSKSANILGDMVFD